MIKKDTIENKIKGINNYIINNIKSNFKRAGVNNKKTEENQNIINDIHYKLKTFSVEKDIEGVFDCNKELLGIYDLFNIYFMSKASWKIEFFYCEKKMLLDFANQKWMKIKS